MYHTAVSAWQTARSMSSAMFSLKVLASLQQVATAGVLGSISQGSLQGSSPHVLSSPSLTPPGNPRSVLHPDNQRALAKRGYYGDNLPEGIDPEILNHDKKVSDSKVVVEANGDMIFTNC